MTIIARHSLSELESRIVPMKHHESDQGRYTTGYGGRIPTRRMVRLPGSKRWRRVYVAQYSNAGTAYVLQGRDWIVIY